MTMVQVTKEDCLSVDDAASHLSVSRATLYNYMNIRLTLKRMAEDGQIEKVGRGEYCAFSELSLLPEE